MTPDEARAAAARWAAEDPDPATRDELYRLLRADDVPVLLERFGSRLQFGTAGLRGPLGAGPSRMNRALVRRAAAGLVAWLGARGAAGAIVVGFDARHGSRAFADETAAVAVAAGRPAVLLPGPVPTPVLAFAVRRLAAAAGVMVTASHNPAGDNGYKVYDASGAQIVPPADAEISSLIDAAPPVPEIPTSRPPEPSAGWVVDDYVAAAGQPCRAPLRVVYTPLHGVGAGVARRVLAAAEGLDLLVVAEQAAPDPDFPTVAAPNPEEPGALDLALGLADDAGADLVLANDPDADRLAVAVPADGGRGERWRVLRGDELGWLLGEQAIASSAGPGRVVATTLVSSGLLARVAADHGVACRTTLTGFKWLARAAGPGERLVYAYEEALGYAVRPDLVSDKDGITAALAVVRLAAGGVPLAERLRRLQERHGWHATRQVSVPADDPGAVLGRLAPLLDGALDLSAGHRGLPPTPGLLAEVDGGRLVVRPSGTEPKVKAYVEAVAASEDDAGRRADALARWVADLLLGSAPG